MNGYLKKFLHRGLVFAGFGPVILGIIYAVLEQTVPGFSLTGGQFLQGTVSVYLLAFLHAGASVIPQIEHWSTAKSAGVHCLILYGAYVGCYLLNNWLPFRWEALLLFTAVFLAVYLTVWLTVLVSLRAAQRRLNRKLQN